MWNLIAHASTEATQKPHCCAQGWSYVSRGQDKLQAASGPALRSPGARCSAHHTMLFLEGLWMTLSYLYNGSNSILSLFLSPEYMEYRSFLHIAAPCDS